MGNKDEIDTEWAQALVCLQPKYEAVEYLWGPNLEAEYNVHTICRRAEDA